MSKIDKTKSPFTPGTPAPPELFVGRRKQVKEIQYYIDRSALGKQDNIFLIGDRGIGKTSLSYFICSSINKENEFFPVHVFLGDVNDLNELVQRIFEELLQETYKINRFHEIKDLFKNHIKEVTISGGPVSIKFNPSAEDLKNIVSGFAIELQKIVQIISKNRKGLFIVLDDIDALSKTPEFANWYKTFVDYIATHYPNNYPVVIMLVGFPEARSELCKNQPSIARVFRIVKIEKLYDNEVKEFFKKAFKEADMKVTAGALQSMVKFSSGFPVLMHEIGDAVFKENNDEKINKRDAVYGIYAAAENIGKKYLDPKIYDVMRSERYRSILQKFGQDIATSFNKTKIESMLNKEEKKVFNNFLNKMKELGVITPDIEHNRGSYKFVNDLYRIYICMRALSKEYEQPKIRENKKRDIIKVIAKKSGLPKEKARVALASFIKVTEETLRKGDKVTLTGFGTFAVRKRAKRTGISPKTGKKIKIPAKVVPFFKPGKKLRETVAK